MASQGERAEQRPSHLNPAFKCCCPPCAVMIEEGPGLSCCAAWLLGCWYTMFCWNPKSAENEMGTRDTAAPPRACTMVDANDVTFNSNTFASRLPPPLHNVGQSLEEDGSTLAKIERFFLFEERGTNWSTELRAGLVTFLTMSYVLVVNPKIMHTHWCNEGAANATAAEPAHASHLNSCPSADDVVIATALSSAVGSFVVGLAGGFPGVLAPGIGLSAYFSYGLVIHGAKLDKEVALATVVVSGVLILLLTATRITGLIMRIMPETIKTATVVGMGLLIAFVGFHSTKMVVPDKESVVKRGDLFWDEDGEWQYPPMLTMIGLMVVGSLNHLQVKGSILIAIVSITLVSWILQVNPWPSEIARVPVIDTIPHDVFAKGLVNMDWNPFHQQCVITPILTFVLVSVLDIAGVMYGLAGMAKLIDDDDNIKGGQASFVSCGIGTILAGVLGSTPVIMGIESASGISEGGRTGVVAVTIGLLFAVATFFAPLLGNIPPQATAPVLILIGTMMAGNAKRINWDDLPESIPAFLTIVVMPFTFSIPNGLAAGIVSYVVLWLITGGPIEWWRARTLDQGYNRVAASEGPEADIKVGGASDLERSQVLERRGDVSPRLQPPEARLYRDSFLDPDATEESTQLNSVPDGASPWDTPARNPPSAAAFP